MRKCMNYVSKALRLKPTDEGLLFDLALTQQQYAQLVHDLPIEKRTSEQVNRAIEYIDSAQETFLKLGEKPAADRSQSSITQPYDPRIAQQRERHGEVIKNKLLRKKQDQDKAEAEREKKMNEMQARRQADEEERRKREEQELMEQRRREEEIAKKRNQLQEQLRQEMDLADRLAEFNVRKVRPLLRVVNMK